MTLASHTFTALAAGPRLFVMAALHGNEYPGALGAARVVETLQAKPALLLRGSVTILPVANPEAYAAKTRYLNVNPNRRFRRHAEPQLYEERLVTSLCDYIDGCDYLLDIHSFTAPAPAPFVFLDYTDGAHLPFAEALGVPYILTGWADLAGAAASSTDYARAQGKTALTLECGQQDDPASVDVAAAAIWRALEHLQMTVPPADTGRPVPAVSRQLRLHTRIIKERAGTLAEGLTHLQPVAAGAVLATYADGVNLTAPLTPCGEAVVILPKADARIGDEWYYLAAPAS